MVITLKKYIDWKFYTNRQGDMDEVGIGLSYLSPSLQEGYDFLTHTCPAL